MGRKNNKNKKANLLLENLLARLFFIGSTGNKGMSLREKKEHADYLVEEIREYITTRKQEIKLLKYLLDDNSNSSDFLIIWVKNWIINLSSIK